MDCAGCGRTNRAGAKFCGGCGRPLAPRCPACGNESQPGSQFCDACGASLLAPQAEAAEARKVVTIVFADLIGSTALHERLDAESARRLMDRYHRAMGAVVEAHGGTVMQLLGDGVLAGFGVPRVAEDDAVRAVRAAVGMQQAFRELAAEQAGLAGEIGLRVAVNTGEVVAGDDHTHVMGDPVNVAARLQQEARDGDVLLGESTQRLVSERVTLAPFGSFALKGRAEPVAAFRVLSLERPAGTPAIAFVGREDELRRIRAVYDTAVAMPAARLAVILGSPGLGKSRLIDEFSRRLGAGATVLLAHCDAAGGATFAPLAEALRGLLRIDDGSGGDGLRAAILSALPEAEPERARIADGIAALVAGTPASPEEIFFVVRRGLAALATQRPVVLAIDDIQWAEPLLHDLLEHLVQWGSDVPLLVLAAARPELRDMRSSLATPGGLVGDVVTLAGLDAGAATKLAANVIGAEALPAAIAGRVLATSEGNPLFVGELVRMLVHDGALRREGERWTAGVEVAGLEMPPTIHALLAARIERLRPEERTVLERAAVIGRHFSRTALAQLLPREITDLDARLESLRRSELVEPDTGWFLGEPVLRFHHVLIRDAAYRRLLKNTRAELHGRFADWLEARAAGSVEHDETLGWHLEQAHQHLSELGPIDAQGRVLGERAARHLAAAGRRALARDDLKPAASLLERALARLDVADPARAELTLDWCEALLSAGDVGTAGRAISELGRFLGDSDRLRAWHTCFGGQLAVFTDPKALRASAEAVEAAAVTLASAGDAAGEAKAHSVHALVLAQLGKIGACEAALDKALAAARRAKDRRRANAVLAGAPVAALWGPSPVTRASGRCLDVVRVLRITQGAPAVEAVALSCQAVLETLRGRAEAARRMIASSRQMVEELGITQRVLEADLFAGLIELLEGDAAAAERCLQVAYDGLRAQGLGIDAAQAAALLGRALLAQGRIAEAEAISLESESLAGDSFKAAIAWRGVRAEALAARGEHAAASEFARAAVEIAAATDDLLDHADARQALAIALRAAGRSAEAAAEEKHAIELWEAKGATLLAERARRGATRSIEAPRSPAVSAAPAPTIPRRVRPNAARAAMSRIAAGVEGRDVGVIAEMLSDTLEVVDHVNGASYGREEFLASFRSLSKPRDLTFVYEPLAVLGDSLAISRRFSSASGAVGKAFDVGAYSQEALLLYEIDEKALVRRVEIFAPDRLGDAAARLYECYADLLPDGPERTRAATTARSVAGMTLSYDMESIAAALAPEVEYVDRRSVKVLGSARGAEGYLRGPASLLEVSVDVALRVDDVLALQSDAVLIRVTQSGTDRTGGGVFERQFLRLLVFGTDGLVRRSEEFDTDRVAEALARFEELTAKPPRSTRRVRPNAATANAARLDVVMAERDADRLPSLLAADATTLHHASGVSYDRRATLDAWRPLLAARDLRFQNEPLATLGDSLALCRRGVSFDSFARRDVDAGATELEEIALTEVDAQGRRRWAEFFGPDRLGDAIVGLYERYAALLPDGPERLRAAATARSVAAHMGPHDVARYAKAIGPASEFVDHRTMGFESVRGADGMLRVLRSIGEVAHDVGNRVDDVLELRSNAYLLRWTNFGTDRVSGGAFERHLLVLWVIGADGLVKRWEQFDADREAEALARFDELTADPPRSERRVRPNAATANVARAAAVTATRSAEALPDLFADDLTVEDHQHGVSYDREGALSTWRSVIEIPDLRFRELPLATLGESLALLCQSTKGVSPGELGAGPFEVERILLIEVDEEGRRRLAEVFALDHLADAVARLYERYAELLPDGPARERAAATARSAAAFLGSFSPNRWAAAFASEIEVVDHRNLGTWSMRGAEALLQNFRAWQPLTDDTVIRFDGILGLESGAFLGRRTFSGTDRTSGGVFERQFIQLCVFGSDGLMTRLEYFETDRDAEALARFDALTAEPPRSERRVRLNAATANSARLDAAIAARDADTLPALVADELEAVDHKTGAIWDRRGFLASWSFLMKAREPTCQHEQLASLGDSLALFRLSTSAAGFSGRTLDVGAYDRQEVLLVECDAQGRRRRVETFATDHLGDAVIRLYERYAELLADGPARARAAGTARAAALMLRAKGADPGRLAEALLPEVEAVDRRTLGTWSAHGAEALMAHYRGIHEVAADISMWVDDVFCLEPEALLVRRIHVGTDRASGGRYERPYLLLLAFAPNGLVSRWEPFDVDRTAEALARFDELTAEPPAARFANASSRLMDRFERCWRERDWDGMVATLAPAHRTDDRRRLVGLQMSAEESLASLRFVFDIPASGHGELLATRGERLALFRVRITGQAADSGPASGEHLQLMELGADGRHAAIVLFDLDDLDAAYAELDARYDAGEAAPYARTWETARRLSRILSDRDWEQWPSVFTQDFVLQDHRRLGWGTRSSDEFLAQTRAMSELAPDFRLRGDHNLAINQRGMLSVGGWVGNREGGPFEITMVSVTVLGPEGRIRRIHTYDLDQLDDARACFEELTPVGRFENAVTRAEDALQRAWEARDWEAFAALFSPHFHSSDRRPLMHLEASRDELLAGVRPFFGGGLQRSAELLATRGERLALHRMRLRGSDGDTGPSEVEWLQVIETDAHGERIAGIAFGPDDLDGAWAELEERFLAGEGAPHLGMLATGFRMLRLLSEREWDQVTSLFSEDFLFVDHRPLGWGTRSRDEFVAQMRTMIELAPDARARNYHILALDRRGILSVAAWVGSREGGSFEIPSVSVMMHGPDGRIRRLHSYALDELEAARACFDALAAEPLPPPAHIENAATRQADRVSQAWAARDWKRLTELYPAGFRSSDRKRMTQSGELDRGQHLEWMRPLFEMSSSRFVQVMLATRGDRLALARQRVEVADHDIGPSEIESLAIIEVDERGERVATVRFDLEDLAAAYQELDARYHAGEAAPHASVTAGMQEFKRAFSERDWAGIAARCAPDIVVHDRRLLGWETLHGPAAYVEALRQLVDLAPDTRLRIDHTEICANGYLVITVWEGTREGGAYEAPSLMVAELDDQGRIRRFDQYDLERIEDARSRFAELRPDPLRIPPNAATRVGDRFQQAFEAHDWDALALLAAPTMVFDDRRRGALISGDRDMFIASTRLISSSQALLSRTLLATAGDRLALERSRWTGANADVGAFEAESLTVREVDAESRYVAIIYFDPDDRRAASLEMTERYLRAEVARGAPPTSLEFFHAWNDHDLARLRAALPDDFYLNDQRRTGLGRLVGADAYVASVRVLLEQTRELTTDFLYYVAGDQRGLLSFGRMFGRLVDGGAFESLIVRLSVYRGGRIAGLEVFEPEDLEVARARFEALGS